MKSPQKLKEAKLKDEKLHPLKLWILELDGNRAHIYERTSAGTEWVCDACIAGENIFLDARSPEDHRRLAAAHRDRPYSATESHYLHGLAGWLEALKREEMFDRAVVVSTVDVMSDLRPVLRGRRCDYLKLATDDILAKNASEDSLAQEMWF